MTWAFCWQILSSFGFGVLSSVVPVFNSEAFIVAAQAAHLAGPLAISIGLALGHGVGKQVIFLAIRHGRKLPFASTHLNPRHPPQPGTWRARWRAWAERTAHLVESPQWGIPILFVSSASGIPPIFLVTVFAATTRMNFWSFSLWVTVGFFVRCYALSLATAGIISLPFHTSG